MKKLWILAFCLCGTLAASSFQDEFLDEVLAIASLNPTEIVEEEKAFLENFRQTCVQQASGKDEEVRPVYVTAQGDFERVIAYMLAEGRIKAAVGTILTPTPTTPLCTEKDISPGLVDASMQEDPRRLFTVMKRPEIVREFLEKGGSLYVAYPESGLAKRSEEQLAIFNQVKEQYPNLLTDLPLPIQSLPKRFVGATYIFEGDDEEEFVFSIRATQANAPGDDTSWTMWFGPLEDPVIKERYKEILLFFDDLRSYYGS